MTKCELASQIATEAGITKAKADQIVNVITSGVTAALRKGDNVTLVGFGTFTTTLRAARKGRNPQTGKEMIIAAGRVPRFKPGKALKEAVR